MIKIFKFYFKVEPPEFGLHPKQKQKNKENINSNRKIFFFFPSINDDDDDEFSQNPFSPLSLSLLYANYLLKRRNDDIDHLGLIFHVFDDVFFFSLHAVDFTIYLFFPPTQVHALKKNGSPNIIDSTYRRKL